jgi:hypothetical protein
MVHWVHGLMPHYSPDAAGRLAHSSFFLLFSDLSSKKWEEEKEWCMIELPHGLCAIVINLSPTT